MKRIRIGTRGSALALWQARSVAAAVTRAGVEARLVTISTRGDRRPDVPLSEIGGKGVFVGEIHAALRRGEIDVAVHSAKDMPAASPEGVTIGAVLPREDPRDALILKTGSVGPLSGGARCRIGTGSPRRVAQLRRSYPAARFEPIRGNVDTRLRKLDAGEVDALVLACAGLRRLGLADRITTVLEVSECIPAPGQGIIAIEARENEKPTIELLVTMNDPTARTELAAEQAVVRELGGGCQLPLGVIARMQGDALVVRAVAASLSGTTIVEGSATGDARDPVETGTRLARDLASRGARELLQT